jgi:hypothetical protein
VYSPPYVTIMIKSRRIRRMEHIALMGNKNCTRNLSENVEVRDQFKELGIVVS